MTSRVRRLLHWLIRPFWRLLLRTASTANPWERLQYRAPIDRFGLGSKHDFQWYLEGESLVTVKSLTELEDWLLECAYARDDDLFAEPDYWQHPRTFEHLRCGDCEDHAVWAWRKLLELGYDADLVSGRRLPWQPGVEGAERGHVWVIFRHEEVTYLLEAVAKTRERLVRPLAEVAAEYRPEFGVDKTCGRFAFNGVLLTMREREYGLGPTIERRTA
jgi:hypothetical protein